MALSLIGSIAAGGLIGFGMDAHADGKQWGRWIVYGGVLIFGFLAGFK